MQSSVGHALDGAEKVRFSSQKHRLKSVPPLARSEACSPVEQASEAAEKVDEQAEACSTGAGNCWSSWVAQTSVCAIGKKQGLFQQPLQPVRRRLHFLRSARFQYISSPVIASNGMTRPAAAHTSFTAKPQY